MLDGKEQVDSEPSSAGTRAPGVNNSTMDGQQTTDDQQQQLLDKQPKEISQPLTASVRKSKMGILATASFATAQRPHGVGADEDEEDDPDIIAQLVDKTPTTRRRIIQEETIKKQKKLGPLATGFTIFKGFVASGILYLPKDFVNGGYGFSALCILAALCLTIYCTILLIEVHAKVGGSLPDIGFKVYGKVGKILVDISLFGSQFGFVCAYIYFIASQVGGPNGIIQCITTDSTDKYDCTGGTVISKWWFLLICMCIFVPLVFVRKISVFATTHLFGDIMIIITIVVLCVYAGIDIGDRGGFDTQGVAFLNTTLWPDAIGFSVYAFEGIGVILPVLEVTERPEIYVRILTITCIIIAIIYIGFTEFVVFGFGPTSLTKPLITDSLPPQSVVTYLVKIAFSFNLICSYPLVIHPANLIMEGYLFGSWPKTRKRQMCKNLTRTCIVASSCVVALLIYDKLDRFLSITGALTCTPIAFTLPALFHFKACAETTKQKVIDMSIVVVTSGIGLYCTTFAILTFND